MFRRICLFIVFASLIFLGTYEIIVVNQFLSHMENVVVEIKYRMEQSPDDITHVYQYVTQEKSYWEKREKNLNLMFNHKDLKTVCDTMNRVVTYISQNDYDNAIVETNVLIESVFELRYVMGFNLDNIL